MFHNTFYPAAIANRLLVAGFNEWRDNPEEWPSGAGGYGRRLGYRMGTLATRNAIQLAGDTAFHTEPRYDLCACSGVTARTLHAWRRVVTAKKDTGDETIGISKIAGAIVTPWVMHPVLPERFNTAGSKFEAGLGGLGMRGVTNMLREFWPDVARTLRLPPRFGGQQQPDTMRR